MTGRLWALTPSYRPVGGVVKILDYVNHALDAGREVVLACPKGSDPDSPLWRMDAFADLPDDPRVRFLEDLRIAPDHDDVVFFSWPSHVRDVTERLTDGFPLSRVVHIVQNTRHANPTFAGGWGVRALARPLTRIMINRQVADACEPFLNPRGITEVIPLGHGADFFATDRAPGLPDTITVGYTTWKSDVGDRVAKLLADDPRFRFEAIRDAADWHELRGLYEASDVFLCAPGPQEGFYLPGLEAMAARSVVLTPDVGGNLAYAFFDENCLEVPFEDEAGYADCLRSVADLPVDRIEQLRDAGTARVRAHSLSQEAERFTTLLDRLPGHDKDLRVVARVPRLPSHRADPAFHVLTGVPRSGTTLATHLLNRVPDVVALGEPLRPGALMEEPSRRALLDAIEAFFESQRHSAVTEGVVESKVVEGRDVDNYVERRDDAGLRVDVAERGRMALDRPVTDAVQIVIKDLSLSTAVLPDLRQRFAVTALVRNPVAVLASWETVDMPFRDGHAPHAEWFSPDLARRLAVDDRRERQLRLLDWWFEQLTTHLPPEHVLRYEDVVATDGRALEVVVTGAKDLDEDLSSRNANEAYATVDIDELVDAVLARDDAAWWAHYGRDEVEALRA